MPKAKPQLLRKILLITIIILVGLMVLVMIVRILTSPKTTSQQKVTLEYWGLMDDPEVMQPLIAQYQKDHPNVEIRYVKKEFTDDVSRYKDLVYTRLVEKTGPAIFQAHITWMPKFYAEVSPLNTTIAPQQFRERFYSVLSGSCMTSKEDILCMPLRYDGLALYYNKDLFDEVNAVPPETWQEATDIARTLTRTDKTETLLRSGIASGSVKNVKYAADILSLFLAQSEITIPSTITNPKTVEVFTYYANLVKKEGLWSELYPDSTTAFATAKTAMMVAPLSEREKVLALNPTLRFGIAPVPQIPVLNGKTTKIGWTNTWVESVSADLTEREKQEAGQFLAWLSLPEQQTQWYTLSKEKQKSIHVPSNTQLYKNFSGITDIGAVLMNASTAKIGMVSAYAGNDPYVSLLFNSYTLLTGDQTQSDKVTEILLQTQKEMQKAIKENR